MLCPYAAHGRYDRSLSRSSKSMRPMRCALLDTVTTRAAPSAGSSSPVSAKWPRWLVASCSSCPSALTRRRRGRHHARVVDQDVEHRVRREHAAPRTGAPTTGRRGRARRGRPARPAPATRTWPSASSPRIRVAAGQQHVRAAPRQLDDGLQADAAVGTGDERGAAGEVGQVGRRPVVRGHATMLTAARPVRSPSATLRERWRAQRACVAGRRPPARTPHPGPGAGRRRPCWATATSPARPAP